MRQNKDLTLFNRDEKNNTENLKKLKKGNHACRAWRDTDEPKLVCWKDQQFREFSGYISEGEREGEREKETERGRERAERMEDRNTEREKQINNPNDRKEKGHRYTDMDV